MTLTLLNKWRYWLPLLVWIGSSLFPQAVFAQGPCDFSSLDSSNPIRPTYPRRANLFAAIPLKAFAGQTAKNLVTLQSASVTGNPVINSDGAYFDGGDYLDFSGIDNNPMSEFTLILRLKQPAFSVPMPAYLSDNTFSQGGFFYLFQNHFYVDFPSSVYYYPNNSSVVINVLQTFAIVQDSTGKVSLYVDGRLVSRDNRSYTSYKTLRLGGSYHSLYDFTGHIYEFFGYDVALPPSEFPTLYDQRVYNCSTLPTPTPTPGPTPVPGSCTDADSCAPLIYQNTNMLITQNTDQFNQLTQINFDLDVLHNDLVGVNTTLQNNEIQRHADSQQLLHAVATLQALQFSPPYYTETITTPAGLETVTRYTYTTSDGDSFRELGIFALALLVGISSISLFGGRS